MSSLILFAENLVAIFNVEIHCLIFATRHGVPSGAIFLHMISYVNTPQLLKTGEAIPGSSGEGMFSCWSTVFLAEPLIVPLMK